MKHSWTGPQAKAGFLAAIGLLALGTQPARAAWEIAKVDTGGVGKSSSLKIDRDGNAHVAYVIEDGNRYPLKYAYWDHQTKRWFTMQVAEAVATCSLALDSNQRPHISYVDFGTASGAKLRHASWDGAKWNLEALPLNSDTVAYYSSIVIDSQDRPSISFYEYRGPRDSDFKIRLRNVTWNGKYWELRTVDPQEGSGKFNAMAIDSRGRIHLGYANVSTGTAGVRYAVWDGSSWIVENVDGPEQTTRSAVGYSIAIAVDPQGDPHLTYMNETTPSVRYAVRKNGKWRIETITGLAGVGYPDRNAIALDDEGRPYISYYDSGRGTLSLAHYDGQKWLVAIIDSNGAGFTSSLALSDGTVWISYADEGGNGLKVAHGRMSDEAVTHSQHRDGDPSGLAQESRN